MVQTLHKQLFSKKQDIIEFSQVLIERIFLYFYSKIYNDKRYEICFTRIVIAFELI